jgi:hypothetical protein
MAAALATQRLGGNSREPIVQTGLVKGPKGDSQAAKAARYGRKTELGLDAAEDEMRMHIAWRKKGTCDFNARMASLNGSLRRGQIPANKGVDIRDARFACGNLREASHKDCS